MSPLFLIHHRHSLVCSWGLLAVTATVAKGVRRLVWSWTQCFSTVWRPCSFLSETVFTRCCFSESEIGTKIWTQAIRIWNGSPGIPRSPGAAPSPRWLEQEGNKPAFFVDGVWCGGKAWRILCQSSCSPLYCRVHWARQVLMTFFWVLSHYNPIGLAWWARQRAMTTWCPRW